MGDSRAGGKHYLAEAGYQQYEISAYSPDLRDALNTILTIGNLATISVSVPVHTVNSQMAMGRSCYWKTRMQRTILRRPA